MPRDGCRGSRSGRSRGGRPRTHTFKHERPLGPAGDITRNISLDLGSLLCRSRSREMACTLRPHAMPFRALYVSRPGLPRHCAAPRSAADSLPHAVVAVRPAHTHTHATRQNNTGGTKSSRVALSPCPSVETQLAPHTSLSLTSTHTAQHARAAARARQCVERAHVYVLKFSITTHIHTSTRPSTRCVT